MQGIGTVGSSSEYCSRQFKHVYFESLPNLDLMQGEGREGLSQEYKEAEHGGQDHGVLELNNIDNVGY